MRLMLLLVAVMLAPLSAGEASRAEREARALEAVLALPEGAKREAGLRVVRQAAQSFRDDAAAAAQEPPADAGDERRARLAELAQRNASAAALRRLAGEGRPIAELAGAHLARWPLDAEVRTLLGLAQVQDGRTDAAWRSLDAVLALGEATLPVRELRGRLAIGSEDPAVAAAAAEDLAPLVTRLLEEGCVAVEAGDAAGVAAAIVALAPLDRAVRGTLAQARAAVLRAAAAEAAGELTAALEAWRVAAAGGVERPDPAPRIRGLVRRLHADRIDAAVAAGDAAELRMLSPAFPERDDLQDRLFRALLTGGRLGEVLAAARELLVAEPGHPLALLLADGAAAALDARRLELLPAAVVRVRLAAPPLAPRFPVLYGLDAALSEAVGDAAGAAEALGPLLQRFPDDRQARWQRARLHLAAGEAASALRDCDELLRTQPDDVDVLALRGRVRAAIGDGAGALADAERVVSLRPGASALLARARVREQLADEVGLRADLAAAVDAVQGVTDVPTLLDVADLAERLKDEALLRRSLERASGLGSADAALRLRRLRR